MTRGMSMTRNHGRCLSFDGASKRIIRAVSFCVCVGLAGCGGRGDSPVAQVPKVSDFKGTPTLPPPAFSIAEPGTRPRTLDGKDLMTVEPNELTRQAYRYAMAGDYTKAVQCQYWHVKRSDEGRYDLACWESLAGNVDAAMFWLQQAGQQAGVDSTWSRSDPDLQNVRDDPRWPAFLNYLVACDRYWRAFGAKQTVLIVPEEYDGESELTLVVWLHGMGHSAESHRKQFQSLADQYDLGFVAVSGTVPTGKASFAWADVPDDDYDRIKRALDEARQQIKWKDGTAVALGFSQGAIVALELAVRHPEIFAGAITISAGTGSPVQLDQVADRSALHQQAFVVVCGAKEPASSIQRSSELARWLKGAKARVRVPSYPDHASHAFPADFDDQFPDWLAFIEHGRTQIPGTDPAGSDATVAARFDQILRELWDQNESVRRKGMRNLTDFQKRKKVPELVVGLNALRAAARPYPFTKPDRETVSAELVSVAEIRPRAEYLPVVLEVFDNLGDSAKVSAQTLIAELPSREAASALMTLVKKYASHEDWPDRFITAPLEKSPRHADVFFPEILTYAAKPRIAADIHRLCLAYCTGKALTPELRGKCADRLLESYAALTKVVGPAQKAEGIAWMWSEEYSTPRYDAEILLDLFGYLPAERAEKPLREALNFKDPRLKHFAIVSLLRLGKDVGKSDVEDVARRPETRTWLYDALKQFDKSALFPPAFRTQKAFAESKMVDWLIYPTELGRVPDEIELMKVVPIDTGLPGGIYDYYVFRFRTKPPHWAAEKGWLAGVSGPFRRGTEPTTESLGGTFSSFEKWESKTPDAHVGDTQELLEQWREYHAKKKP